MTRKEAAKACFTASHSTLTDELFQKMLDFLEQRRADEIMKHITESLMSPKDKSFEDMKEAIAKAARNDNPTELHEALERYASHLHSGGLTLLCETNFKIVKEAAQS